MGPGLFRVARGPRGRFSRFAGRGPDRPFTLLLALGVRRPARAPRPRRSQPRSMRAGWIRRSVHAARCLTHALGKTMFRRFTALAVTLTVAATAAALGAQIYDS